MTATVVTAVLGLSALSLVTTFAGVALALRTRRSDRLLTSGIGFSVGVMILVSLCELLPESVSNLGPLRAAAITALGAGSIWVANLLIPHIHLAAEVGTGDTAPVRTLYLVVFGLVLHDLPEGFAMANSYVAAPASGIVTAIAIALHNLPEEFAMAVPAIAIERRGFLFRAALLSALAEPIGALIGLAAVGLAPGLNAVFIAFAAGAMLFVAVHELIPMARRYGCGRYFVAGAASSVIIYAMISFVTANALERVTR